MRGLLILVSLIGICLATVAKATTAASKGRCSRLKAEIQAMSEAQKTLLNNMVQNNDSMASTLDQYSKQLKQASKIRRPVTTKEVVSLHQSAETFRSHGRRESKLVARFNRASGDLLRRVEACLR